MGSAVKNGVSPRKYTRLSICGLKCTTNLRVKIHHSKISIFVILEVDFVENFMPVCLRFC